MQRASILGLVLGAACLVGCATTRRPPYVPKPIASYQYRAVQGDLALAVEPVPQEEIERHFGRDIASAGYLPILIAIENQSTDRSFFVLTERIHVGDATTTSPDPENPTASKVLQNVGAGLVSLPLILIGSKMQLDIEANERELAVQAFHDHTLSPGETESGFVFPAIPAGVTSGRWTLRLVAIDAQDGSSEPLELAFDWTRSR